MLRPEPPADLDLGRAAGGALGPQLEAALRRSLIYSRGDLLVFFERPISAALLALALVMLASPALRRVLGRRVRAIAGPAAG